MPIVLVLVLRDVNLVTLSDGSPTVSTWASTRAQNDLDNEKKKHQR